jgi:hypothetical protein
MKWHRAIALTALMGMILMKPEYKIQTLKLENNVYENQGNCTLSYGFKRIANPFHPLKAFITLWIQSYTLENLIFQQYEAGLIQ